MVVSCVLFAVQQKNQEEENGKNANVIYLPDRYFFHAVGWLVFVARARNQNMDKIHFMREDSVLISNISRSPVCDDTSTV